MNHPKWAIKYVHKSKINAVHIVNWEDHHHIATIPHVYTHNGEKSEGAKAADLIAAAPELLDLVYTYWQSRSEERWEREEPEIHATIKALIERIDP